MFFFPIRDTSISTDLSEKDGSLILASFYTTGIEGESLPFIL
jgi:hypothetical protein